MRRLLNLFNLQLPIWLVTPMLALMLMAGAGGGYFTALRITTPCPQSPEVCASFANFWKAWDVASANFVDPEAIEPQRMTDGAITGMLDSLGDQGHTRYLPPAAAQAEREALSGRFEGIGAYIDVRDDQPLIIQPIDGSPAARAGIKPGDLIIQVNGEDVRGITVDELQAKVRGPRGTSVTLTLQHESGETTYEVTITREEIKVPSVTWRMLPDNVALIRLIQFSEPSSEEMIAALQEAQAQGATSVVLDLRNNPGGLVNELVTIASQFLPPDTAVLLEQNREGERTPFNTEQEGVARDIPLVVLVNNNSASSAEILAGALKEYDRATVIGVPTFGTATVLRRFDLNDGAQMYLGTTEWLTPNGEQVRNVGIEPNEIVALPPGIAPLSPADAAELNVEELLDSEDVQLVAALKEAQRVARR
jgi:carboxyl-terminal processing protease